MFVLRPFLSPQLWLLMVVPPLAGAPLVLNSKRLHLGTAGSPEWETFAGHPPDARRLDIVFEAQPNPSEATLLIRQDDVRQEWRVELNGTRLGKLFLMEADLTQSLPIPGGTLREGSNQLSILPPTVLPAVKPGENDDIVLHEIQIDQRPMAEALSEATLVVEVSDTVEKKPLPCRITLVDQHGALASLVALPGEPGVPGGPTPKIAVRPGVVYTGNGRADVGLRAGDYTIFASRGFEWSVATQKVRLVAADRKRIGLQLLREVPTPGLVSCDTHVHTVTHSGHGDATIEERMLTIAGEGIELPVATDHNFHANYVGPAQRMGVSEWFTPVNGNEVTTATGHFNIFPIQPGVRVPSFNIADWTALMSELRATPRVQVVILNHPRNIHSNFQPFAAAHFNHVTGENKRGAKFAFDAIELLNSSAQQSDFMLVYRDWFALLNHGYRLPGVGSSDSHDVSRYIIGQGRTYISCPDENPARIDVTKACANLVAGRALVSMGLLTKMTVDEKFGVGDVATGLGGEVTIKIHVLGPSWVRAANATLFANGFKIREQAFGDATSPDDSRPIGTKGSVTWTMPRPAHDVHLLAIATGPAVTAPFWAIPKPYQPTSPRWEGRVIGLTNPIWLDADGDGQFTSARAYAERLIAQHGSNAAALLPALGKFDEAIAIQTASLLPPAAFDAKDPEWPRALKSSAAHVQSAFAAFAATKSERETP